MPLALRILLMLVLAAVAVVGGINLLFAVLSVDHSLKGAGSFLTLIRTSEENLGDFALGSFAMVVVSLTGFGVMLLPVWERR
ncbi:hypothetical protein JNJ66_05255 [Candidatus Saccharibacteria bacterium]|nr:hypothetical protein [Candidatus Saccharibacteria bacterium]